VLPFIERTINGAMKEQKDGFGNQFRIYPPTKKEPPKADSWRCNQMPDCRSRRRAVVRLRQRNDGAGVSSSKYRRSSVANAIIQSFAQPYSTPFTLLPSVGSSRDYQSLANA